MIKYSTVLVLLFLFCTANAFAEDDVVSDDEIFLDIPNPDVIDFSDPSLDRVAPEERVIDLDLSVIDEVYEEGPTFLDIDFIATDYTTKIYGKVYGYYSLTAVFEDGKKELNTRWFALGPLGKINLMKSSSLVGVSLLFLISFVLLFVIYFRKKRTRLPKGTVNV